MAKNVNVYQLVKKLLLEIKVINERIEQLQRENEIIEKMMGGPKEITAQQYDSGPRSTDKPVFEKLAIQHLKNNNEINTLGIFLESKNCSWENIKQFYSPTECFEAKVAYMRLFEGKTHQEIADATNYSVDYIKKVSARFELAKVLIGEVE